MFALNPNILNVQPSRIRLHQAGAVKHVVEVCIGRQALGQLCLAACLAKAQKEWGIFPSLNPPFKTRKNCSARLLVCVRRWCLSARCHAFPIAGKMGGRQPDQRRLAPAPETSASQIGTMLLRNVVDPAQEPH